MSMQYQYNPNNSNAPQQYQQTAQYPQQQNYPRQLSNTIGPSYYQNNNKGQRQSEYGYSSAQQNYDLRNTQQPQKKKPIFDNPQGRLSHSSIGTNFNTNSNLRDIPPSNYQNYNVDNRKGDNIIRFDSREAERQQQQLIEEQKLKQLQIKQQAELQQKQQQQQPQPQPQPQQQQQQQVQSGLPKYIVTEQHQDQYILEQEPERVKRAQAPSQVNAANQDIFVTSQAPVQQVYQKDKSKEQMDIYLYAYNHQEQEDNFEPQIKQLQQQSEHVAACTIF